MASPDTPSFWKRLDELFNQAMDLDPSRRQQFVEESCGEDAHLRAELESLVHAAETSDELEGLVHGAAQDFLFKKPPTLQAGSRVAGYEVLSLLGAGGMGQVYLAQDLRLRRKVAIKTLNPESVYDRHSLGRFEQEALAASALNHPNILTIYEVGKATGLEFIASEFVDGPTLREKISAGNLELSEVLDIAIQVATGLAAAHAAGIVHRDIKPENIIVRSDGIVKILDFGIAKLSADSSGNPTHAIRTYSGTRPGIIMGTARYMAPEQAQGLPVDGRADIFSLGVVLDELLANRYIFKGAAREEIMAELLKDDPAPPVALSRIVNKAMHQNREQRYQSARELLDALQAFKRDREFPAPPPPAEATPTRCAVRGPSWRSSSRFSWEAPTSRGRSRASRPIRSPFDGSPSSRSGLWNRIPPPTSSASRSPTQSSTSWATSTPSRSARRRPSINTAIKPSIRGKSAPT